MSGSAMMMEEPGTELPSALGSRNKMLPLVPVVRKRLVAAGADQEILEMVFGEDA